MRILVMSDSHSANILNHTYEGYDYIIHCGDINTNDYYYLSNYTNLIVKGNCDFHDEVIERIITIKSKKIWITHSHLYHTKSSYEWLIDAARNKQVDIVFFGHTHERAYFEASNITFINPGAYNDGAFVEITDNEILFLEESTSLTTDEPILYEKIERNLF